MPYTANDWIKYPFCTVLIIIILTENSCYSHYNLIKLYKIHVRCFKLIKNIFIPHISLELKNISVTSKSRFVYLCIF